MLDTFKKNITHLHNVPVDKEHEKRLLRILESHGTSYSLTATKERFSPQGGRCVFHEYTLEFPAGTIQEYGLRMHRSAPFTIIFPDGCTLRGADLYTVDGPLDETPVHILYLPKLT